MNYLLLASQHPHICSDVYEADDADDVAARNYLEEEDVELDDPAGCLTFHTKLYVNLHGSYPPCLCSCSCSL